jgi:hypothetical protein
MWFEKRRDPVDASAPKHWPTERMIQEGHADYATPEDLEGLDDSLLVDIAQICEVDEMASEECIPCLALEMYHQRIDDARKQLEEIAPPPILPQVRIEEIPVEDLGGDVQPFPEPIRAPEPDKPVVERFAEQVRALDGLVAELLSGPPIPPPNVSLEELGLLTVAAQRWIRITEAQGVELSPTQEQVLDATRTVVARLNHG